MKERKAGIRKPLVFMIYDFFLLFIRFCALVASWLFEKTNPIVFVLRSACCENEEIEKTKPISGCTK